MTNLKYVICKKDNWEKQYFESMVFAVKEENQTMNLMVVIDDTEDNEKIEIDGIYNDFCEINKDEYEEIMYLLDDNYFKKYPQYVRAIERLNEKYLK